MTSALAKTEKESTEIWVPVVGYKGFYSVSNLGRIRSEDRMINNKNGGYVKEGIVLNPNGGKYLSVKMCNGSSKKTKAVHIIVATSFIGECAEGQEVMHLDGVKHNNKLENLRYGSRSCNFAFKVDDGTDNCGERGSNSKLTKNEVIRMRWMWRLTGYSYAKMAKMFLVSPMTAFRAINKQCWRCV